MGSMMTLSMQKVQADDAVPKRIEAQEFRLVDAHGESRLKIGFSTHNGIQRPRIDLTEDTGYALVTIALDKDNIPYVRLNNPELPALSLRQRKNADRRLSPDERAELKRMKQQEMAD